MAEAPPTEPSESAVDGAYRDGRYHGAVFDRDPFVESVVAQQRAAKLGAWVRPEDAVFEYGVGTALNLRELKCARRVGCDPSPEAASICAEHGIEHVADLETLGADRFDVVLCHHVLEHVLDPHRTLCDLRRIVADGGRLVLVVPYEFNRRYRRWWPEEPNRHLFAWNALTLGNLATAAGWRVRSVSIGSYGYQQRLAGWARCGMPVYRTALWLANRLRPCREIRLVARP